MATITSSASGNWSAGGTWVGGVIPADDDAVVIAAGHSILMDYDASALTGFRTVTITSAAVTPAMLYFMSGTSGDLKIRTGYNLLGTSGAAKGRLLANSDGIWGNTGSLAFADKAIIDLGATSIINAQYLDIALYCTQPTNWYVRTYETKYDFVASAGTVDVVNNTIDLGVAPPAAGTSVMITTAAGVLPTGLMEDFIYYVRTVSGTTCKLASQNSDATIIDITGTGSGTCTLFTGHTSTSTAVMNVLEDVTADAPWITTDGHDRVVLANAGPQNDDQQRLQLTTIAAGSITLSANVNSVQYPGARITLSSRNVSIRSACVTAVTIVLYTSATTSSGVFQCEIVSTAGTGNTFYGNAIVSGAGHTISGTIMGCGNALNTGTNSIISGTLMACSIGFIDVSGATISGTIIGCSIGIYRGAGNTLSGFIIGCTNAFLFGINHTISGTVMGCSTAINQGNCYIISGTIKCCDKGIYVNNTIIITGSIFGCATGIYMAIDIFLYGNIGHNSSGQAHLNSIDFSFNVGNEINLLRVIVFPDSVIPSLPAFSNRNLTYLGDFGCRQWVGFEDYGKSAGASYAYHINGNVSKNTSTVRTGGAANSIEVEPLSNCSTTAPILMLEWEEMSVPASQQIREIYVKGGAWVSFPTAAQLYIEAEYLSNASTFARSTIASTEVISDNTTWTALSVTFTPAVVGRVRYRAYLKAYVASGRIYIDNALYRTNNMAKNANWKSGMSTLLIDLIPDINQGLHTIDSGIST